jgi:hypothetical protein
MDAAAVDFFSQWEDAPWGDLDDSLNRYSRNYLASAAKNETDSIGCPVL